MLALEAFVATKSSGLRLQAICAALFETMNSSFTMADEIKTQAVNASDKSMDFSDMTCGYYNSVVFYQDIDPQDIDEVRRCSNKNVLQ